MIQAIIIHRSMWHEFATWDRFFLANSRRGWIWIFIRHFVHQSVTWCISTEIATNNYVTLLLVGRHYCAHSRVTFANNITHGISRIQSIRGKGAISMAIEIMVIKPLPDHIFISTTFFGTATTDCGPFAEYKPKFAHSFYECVFYSSLRLIMQDATFICTCCLRTDSRKQGQLVLIRFNILHHSPLSIAASSSSARQAAENQPNKTRSNRLYNLNFGGTSSTWMFCLGIITETVRLTLFVKEFPDLLLSINLSRKGCVW